MNRISHESRWARISPPQAGFAFRCNRCAALHSVGLGEDLGVREAQNGEALAGEPSFALRVVLDTVDMDRPVRFDHTCSFVTKEVHDEAADRSLPAELRAQKLAAAHELPEHPFCRRLVSAKLARRPRPRSSHSLPSVVDASCFQNSRSRRPPSPAWRKRAGVRAGVIAVSRASAGAFSRFSGGWLGRGVAGAAVSRAPVVRGVRSGREASRARHAEIAAAVLPSSVGRGCS
jgi:hypothetical protein